jgi:DNA transposase THAP9
MPLTGWLVNIKTITELFEYIVQSGELNFLLTFKLSQDPLENFFSSIRMSCGSGNTPTSVQFKAAFQSLLCKTLNKKDDGNCLFEENLPVLELAEVSLDLNMNFENIVIHESKFVNNVLVYIAGFIMRTMIKKENCTFCYTYMKESTDRVTCTLIEKKQRGGLLSPICDFVSTVEINRNVKLLYIYHVVNFPPLTIKTNSLRKYSKDSVKIGQF